MRIGYARTSTVEQVAGLEAQLRDLSDCERVFSEQLSSVDAERPQLQAALDYVREGDVLVVTKLDRLARSVVDLIAIKEKLDKKGVGLVIKDMALDTTTPTGELMFHVVGAIAQFERRIMLTRQREGIAKAKAEGKYKGRKPTAREKAAEIERLLSEGVKPAEVARRLGIARSSVYNVIGDKANGAAS